MMEKEEMNPAAYVRFLLLGILLAVAVLDHTRLFFHYWNTNPADLSSTTSALFFTRFISHYFAPAVFFLMGIAAYVSGKGQSKAQVSWSLIKNGSFLLLLELVVNNFLWTFDPLYRTIGLFIVGALGLSMLGLAVLHYLPRQLLLLLSLLLIFGHHLLDGIVAQGTSGKAIAWYIFHQQKFLPTDFRLFVINYTVLPWLAVLSLGYCFGALYTIEGTARRKEWLLVSGVLATGLFFILRGINGYGDLRPWSSQETTTQTVLSFFHVTKYPASLDYLLITLGPIWLFLYAAEGAKNRLTDFFVTLGKVPVFTYLVSTLLLHLVAMIGLWMGGDVWQKMILTSASYEPEGPLAGYGYSLGLVYLIWLGFMVALYGLCRVYEQYTQALPKSRIKVKL